MITRRALLAGAGAALLPTKAYASNTWVFLGDSITANWATVPGLFHAGAINSGVAGNTTQQMIDRFSTDVLSYSPFGMVLLGGINDINGLAGATSTGAIASRLVALCDMAHAHGIRVVLCSIMQQGTGRSPSPGQMQQVIDVNAISQSYVMNHRRARYCDYYTPMTGVDGYAIPSLFSDGLHPNASGYAVMSPLTEAAITAVTAVGALPLPQSVWL